MISGRNSAGHDQDDAQNGKTHRTVSTAPTNVDCERARASNIAPAMCRPRASSSALGPAQETRQPDGKQPPLGHRLRQGPARFDLAGHEAARAVEVGILDAFARQPERLGQGKMAFQQQGQQMTELGQRRGRQTVPNSGSRPARLRRARACQEKRAASQPKRTAPPTIASGNQIEFTMRANEDQCQGDPRQRDVEVLEDRLELADQNTQTNMKRATAAPTVRTG